MISVVVVTYNRKRLLKRCLDSLLNQNFNKECEIIIIDNGSDDGTEEFIKKEYNRGVKFINNKKRLNLSTCKNLGIEIASGDITAFIDDDCVASNNWLEVIQDSLGNYDIVGGAVLPITQAQFPWWWRSSLDWLIGINPKPNKKILPIGSNIAFKKYALEKLQEDEKYNPIDNNQYLPYAEDNYRVKRALTLGFSIKINQDMIVYHYIPRQRLKIAYLIRRSYNDGFAWATRERDVKIFIYRFIALIINPVRFLISWDINQLFRMIVSISYMFNYFGRQPLY